jgi:hypothetical protein
MVCGRCANCLVGNASHVVSTCPHVTCPLLPSCPLFWCRITIPEIRSHPWFHKPLPPPYNVAMADLYNEQRKINEQVRVCMCMCFIHSNLEHCGRDVS